MSDGPAPFGAGAIFSSMKNVRPKPPNITLDKLLRRRGLTFDTWMSSAYISSYPEVVRWCFKVGVIAPSEEEYRALRPSAVSAPLDGIVVVEPTELPSDFLVEDPPVVVAPAPRSRKSKSTPA